MLWKYLGFSWISSSTKLRKYFEKHLTKRSYHHDLLLFHIYRGFFPYKYSCAISGLPVFKSMMYICYIHCDGAIKSDLSRHYLTFYCMLGSTWLHKLYLCSQIVPLLTRWQDMPRAKPSLLSWLTFTLIRNSNFFLLLKAFVMDLDKKMT